MRPAALPLRAQEHAAARQRQLDEELEEAEAEEAKEAAALLESVAAAADALAASDAADAAAARAALAARLADVESERLRKARRRACARARVRGDAGRCVASRR